MSYQDLRGWLDEVEKLGELKQIDGAHWDRELGGISEMLAERDGPALLFDKIQDYPEGYRVLSNPFTSLKRTASVIGVDTNLSGVEMVDAWRKRLKDIKPISPVEVPTGPIKENVMTGDDVDLYKFPTPIWHEHDVGRFIGTGCAIVSKDPDEGWSNLGCYRCQIQDKNLITVGLNPGKHGTMMMDKYHSRGESFPLAVICGMEPTLFLAASTPLTGKGEGEYDFAGWVKGQPIEVTKGEYTGLQIPAGAEIVLEGEIPPPPKMERRTDGPFGEWRRTYNASYHPVMEVKSISYRNDPIMLGVVPQAMHLRHYFSIPIMAAEIWNVLEYAGIPDVKGVWFGLGMVWPVFLVISIKHGYTGHAKQAALAAASCKANTLGGMFVIVVDEDIDITDERDVIWAVANRTNMDDVQVIHGIQTKAGAGPKIVTDPDGNRLMVNDRVIIDACWPYERSDKYPEIHRFSSQYQEELKKKWPSLF